MRQPTGSRRLHSTATWEQVATVAVHTPRARTGHAHASMDTVQRWPDESRKSAVWGAIEEQCEWEGS